MMHSINFRIPRRAVGELRYKVVGQTLEDTRLSSMMTQFVLITSRPTYLLHQLSRLGLQS